MNVVVLGKIQESGLALLRSDPSLNVIALSAGEVGQIDRYIAETAAILVRTSVLSEELLARAPHLKVVSRYGVGVDNIDVAALTRRGIPVAVVGQANAVSVAEHTFYLMLSAAKKGSFYDRAVRSGDWQAARDSLAATELAGKSLLIVGMGRIGCLVGKIADAFGMKIGYFDPSPKATDLPAGWTAAASLHEGLREADVVSVHAPLVEQTRSLIGVAEFAAMKSSAVIVATSRGGVVDEAALIDALSTGRIRAAGLDVFEAEPIEADSPLLRLDNVVLSPHIAALTYEGAERMSLTAAANCLDGIRGRLNPELVVNPAVLTG